MEPLRLIENPDGTFCLFMPVCERPLADEVVEAFEHTPNGYFWEGIAQWLLSTNADLVAVADSIKFDSEGGTFVSLSADKTALESLGAAMSDLINEPDRLRATIESAINADFEFDD